VALAIASVVAALILAHGLGRLLFADGPASPLRLVLPIAAGLGLWSLVLLAAGMAGLYHRTGLALLTGVLVIPAVVGGKRLLEDLRTCRLDGVSGLLVAAIALMFAWGLPRALEPSVDVDTLRYHLAAPKLWLEAGGMHYVPLVQINGPAAAQGLNGLFLAFPGERGATVFALATLAVATALVGTYTARHYGSRAGAIAAAAFAATLSAKEHIGSASEMPLFAGFAAGTTMIGLGAVLVAADLGREMHRRTPVLSDVPPAIEFINRELPPTSTILVHGTRIEVRLHRRYVPVPPIVGTAILWSEIRSAEALAARIRALGVTHVLVTEHFGSGYPSPPEPVLRSFLSEHGRILYRRGRISIWSVRP